MAGRCRSRSRSPRRFFENSDEIIAWTDYIKEKGRRNDIRPEHNPNGNLITVVLSMNIPFNDTIIANAVATHLTVAGRKLMDPIDHTDHQVHITDVQDHTDKATNGLNTVISALGRYVKNAEESTIRGMQIDLGELCSDIPPEQNPNGKLVPVWLVMKIQFNDASIAEAVATHFTAAGRKLMDQIDHTAHEVYINDTQHDTDKATNGLNTRILRSGRYSKEADEHHEAQELEIETIHIDLRELMTPGTSSN